MVDNTDYASQKINDFKQAYKVAMNPFENKAVDDVIDSLFENVSCYYEQYRDSIAVVPTVIENYRYHLIQPTESIKAYELLDFLINRAISNLDGIELTTEDSSYKNRRLSFNASKYREYERYGDEELVADARRKTLLKETGKVLYSYDFSDDKTLHTSLDCSKPSGFTPTKKIGCFIGCLKSKYPDMLTVDEVINAVKNYDCNDTGSIPFNSEVLALTAQEYYSTKFADMFGREKIKLYKPLITAHINGEKRRKMIVITPNSLSRFAGGGRFIYHLENLVNKPAMFSSMFFGREDAIKEFAFNYKECVDKVWDDFYKKSDDDKEISTEEKFKALLINACDMTKTDDEQKNEQRYISQSALDMVFLSAYHKAYDQGLIPRSQFKEIFRESSIITPSIYDVTDDKIRSSKTKNRYEKMYARMVTEPTKQTAEVTKIAGENKDDKIEEIG